MFISAPTRDKDDDAKAAVGLISVRLAEVAAFGEGLPEVWFDYNKVPKENRAELLQIAADVKNAIRRSLASALEIGEGLLRGKEKVGHGNFGPWLAFEFRWSERLAQDYMAIAKVLQGKSASFADLNLSTARALVKAPADVRDGIMARAAAGEVISMAEVKKTLARVGPQPAVAIAHVPATQSEPAVTTVIQVQRSERQLIIPTIGYVLDPPPAPVEEPARAVAASADISRRNLETILSLLPTLTARDFSTLANTVAGEQPTRTLQ